MPKRVVRKLRKAHRERDWKMFAMISCAILAVFVLVVQLVYPWGNMLPMAQVDGVNVGWMSKSEAVKKLEETYQTSKVNIVLGTSTKPHRAPTLAQLGATADVKGMMKNVPYPWYLRLVPTSILWGHLVQRYDAPKVAYTEQTNQYIEKQLMPSCREAPKDANLVAKDGKLEVIKSNPGGKCEQADVVKSVKSLSPQLKKGTTVKIALTEVPADITDQAAAEYAKSLTARLSSGLRVQVGEQIVIVPMNEAVMWMTFDTNDGVIVPHFSGEKSADYFAKNISPKVARAAGTTLVTTRDFEELSRVEGAVGQEINLAATLEAFEAYVTNKSDTIVVATRPIPATVTFTRTYSQTDAGLNALIANFAKDKKGSFGISYAELDGKKRRANYNGDQQFVTASTYKLFVGYSVLKRVEAGTFSWESVSGCFNKMISLSDNPCSEDFLLNKVGIKNTHNEAVGLGLKNTSFNKSGGPYTTANDLAAFLGSLQSGQSLNGVSRERLISAMSANVYRKGIPAGSSGSVADKVGFMDGLLHDAAIVYAPNGTYVLAVMSDGSSWDTIATFTRELEKIR